MLENTVVLLLSSFYCATTITRLIISVAMVRAGYVSVSIIHRTLTWTTGSLKCTQMLMHSITHGDVRTSTEGPHRKLTLGEGSFAAPGTVRNFQLTGVGKCCSQLLSDGCWKMLFATFSCQALEIVVRNFQLIGVGTFCSKLSANGCWKVLFAAFI